MSRWAYVNNNQVEETYYNLPESWRNISNLYAAENDLDLLKSLGWYPVIDTTMPLADTSTQTYGPTTYQYDMATDTVTLSTEIIAIEPPPGPSFDTLRSIFMQTLRSKRDLLISQSDWTQLQDIIMIKGPQWQTEWMNYRQLLRDMPKNYDDNFPEEIIVENIKWPSTPVN